MEAVGVERPVFIPPRKRQSARRGFNTLSHVDHIMTVQGRIPTDLPSPRHPSPSSPLGEKPGGGSIQNIMRDRPKMELPTILDDEIYTAPVASMENIDNKEGVKAIHYLSLNQSREMIDLSPIYENSSESNEMSSFDNLNQSHFNKMEDVQESSTVEPNSLSQTQSDNSINVDSNDLLSNSARSKKSKKRVNYQTEYNSQEDIAGVNDRVVPKQDSETSGSLDRSMLSGSTEGYLTMTGTIKRGRKKGQCVDVQLNISREELEILEATIVAKELNKRNRCCTCNLKTGIHVLFWSLFCLPIITLISSIYSFYIGTITWYNVFVYFNEEKSYLLKLFISPILVIVYPFAIIVCTVGLGLYAGVAQVTICGVSWWKEVWDIEKGFYGWLCSVLRLSDCSPYEVVVLTDLRALDGVTRTITQSSTEEMSM